MVRVELSREALPRGRIQYSRGLEVLEWPSLKVSGEWLRLFVLNDRDFDLTTLSFEQYDALSDEYKAKAADSDFSEFRATGGKMITWRGLADEAIFANGTSNYYQKLLERDPLATGFYRYFEAPGVAHCQVSSFSAPYRKTSWRA